MMLSNNPAGDHYQLHLTPYFRRIRSKDQANLAKWHQSYQEIQNFNERPLELQIRKIRLNKLLQNIKRNVEQKALRNLRNPPIERPKPKSLNEIKRDLLLMARMIGNEYSKKNRDSNRNPTPRTICPDIPLVLRGKMYGNTKSREYLKKQKESGSSLNLANKDVKKSSLSTQQKSIITLDRQKSKDYGNYYSTREKIRAKQIRDEYDLEYFRLRGKCLEFELSHPDVKGIFHHLAGNTSTSKLNSQEDILSNKTSSISVLKTTNEMVETTTTTNVDNNEETETFQSRTEFYLPSKQSNSSTSGTEESIVHTYNYILDDNSYITPSEQSTEITSDDETQKDDNKVIHVEKIASVQSMEKFESCESKPQMENTICDQVAFAEIRKLLTINRNWKGQANGLPSDIDLPMVTNTGHLLASILPAKSTSNALNAIEDVIQNKDG